VSGIVSQGRVAGEQAGAMAAAEAGVAQHRRGRWVAAGVAVLVSYEPQSAARRLAFAWNSHTVPAALGCLPPMLVPGTIIHLILRVHMNDNFGRRRSPRRSWPRQAGILAAVTAVAGVALLAAACGKGQP
jgi:hypothetical protein